jgi:hypothetical protein
MIKLTIFKHRFLYKSCRELSSTSFELKKKFYVKSHRRYLHLERTGIYFSYYRKNWHVLKTASDKSHLSKCNPRSPQNAWQTGTFNNWNHVITIYASHESWWKGQVESNNWSKILNFILINATFLCYMYLYV